MQSNANPLRWLLVGTGDIVRKRVASALRNTEGSRLDAVCSARPDRAVEFAAEAGIGRVYSDYHAALADPEIDAVYIATPVALHVDQALHAMEAGKHVLVEKPLGLDGPDALRAAAKASERGLVAGCAYYRRCFPSFINACDLVASGRLGQLLEIRCSYASWFNPAPDDPKYWRVQRGMSGGGPLADMGSHMLDLMIRLAGAPTRVFGKVSTETHPYPVEDNAQFLLAFPGGAVAQGSFRWNSHTWSHDLEIIGTEGRLRWNVFDSGLAVKTIGRDTEELRVPNAENVHLPPGSGLRECRSRAAESSGASGRRRDRQPGNGCHLRQRVLRPGDRPMNFEPRPPNDFLEFIHAYWDESKAVCPRLAAMSGKWGV